MSSIALKFTSLLVRTLSKPIASQAKQHPRFRKICIDFAQLLHRADMHMRIKLLGEKNMKVRPLNDAKAIDNGATFISETFLFSVAGSLILFESFRQRRKELVRREGVADDIRALQDEIEWLRTMLQKKKIIDEEYHLPGGVEPLILKLEHKEGNIVGEEKESQLLKSLQSLLPQGSLPQASLPKGSTGKEAKS